MHVPRDFLCDRHPVSLLELAGAALYLSDVLDARVDLVPKRSVREELRGGILREAVAP